MLRDEYLKLLTRGESVSFACIVTTIKYKTKKVDSGDSTTWPLLALHLQSRILTQNRNDHCSQNLPEIMWIAASGGIGCKVTGLANFCNII